MADFEKLPRPVPTNLGRIDFMFWTGQEGGPLNAEFRIQVLDANGEVMGQKTGNLLNHMTPAEITQVTNFVNNKRAMAKPQILAP